MSAMSAAPAGRCEASTLPSLTMGRVSMRPVCTSNALAFAALISGYLATKGYAPYDVSAHSKRQNLVHLGATDVCEMYPLNQFGSPFDKAGRQTAPVMTVYLRAPEGRRPPTRDVLEIVYPKELEGRVRFSQATNDGYGGSGPLEWIGEIRKAKLGMAVLDSTQSGSLQYDNGKAPLWGDCKKSFQLKA